MPPPLLRYRVHGELDREGFLRLAGAVEGAVRSAATDHGVDIGDRIELLDFGCGCGRLLRRLGDVADSGQLHGTDIDAEAVAWCRRRLPFADVTPGPHHPPSPYPAGSFDVVVAISVLTHLDRELGDRWLAELARVCRPGGLVLATVHGAGARANLGADEEERLAREGIAFTVGGTGRFKLDGLPDFYQTTFHSRRFVEEEWGRRFEIAEIREGAIEGWQDLVVMRPRLSPPSSSR